MKQNKTENFKNINILEVKNLSKSFKRHFWSKRNLVLNDLNFSVPKGTATGFLGSNGSGKTTTFKCMLDLIKKDSGQVLFFNQSLSIENRSRIGFLPEKPQLYEELTAEECLYFYASLKQKLTSRIKKEIEEGLKKLNLYNVRHKQLKTFSKGMLQKISILQALIPKSDLLILDEPFSGLDPESRFTVAELLDQQLQQGVTLFFSSHIFQDVEKICDRLLILKEGKCIFQGEFSEFYNSTSTSRSKILYLLNGKKQSFISSTQKESQEKLKHLIEKEAVILSIQSEGQNLEQKYKEIMEKS
ncbi:MAG: ABC transporter ATP-binding protein [Bdellovibrionaceae bacterium]|nr:ABC transporter ATP-binding protein [Pseudobdellovibrionaceae bacterium]